MKEIDFEYIRLKIRETFLQWYDQKPKDPWDEEDFTKSFETANLKTFEELEKSFKQLVGASPGASTFRNLFYYKKENFHNSNLRLFYKYIEKTKDEDDGSELLNRLRVEFEKWDKSLKHQIVSHHYFMPLDFFTKVFNFVEHRMDTIGQKYIRLLMVTALYYGDPAFHTFIDRCRNDIELIKLLFRFVVFSWIRVSWRSAYVLSKLNQELVKEVISKVKLDGLTDIDKKLIEKIKLDQIEQYLVQITENERNADSIIYANQVIRQIRSKPKNIFE